LSRLVNGWGSRFQYRHRFLPAQRPLFNRAWDVQPPYWSRTNQWISEGLRPRANARPRPRPRTSTGLPRSVPSPRRRNHQLRTRRQSGKHNHHSV